LGEERIVRDRRAGGTWKKYMGYGITAFLVIAASIIFIFMFIRSEDFGASVAKVKKAFAPAMYGIVFAYLLNPLMNFFEDFIKAFLYKHAKRITRAKKTARVISIILAIVVVVFCVGIILYLLLPELTVQVSRLSETLPEQSREFIDWINGIATDDTPFAAYIGDNIQKGTEFVENFIENDLLDYATSMLSSVASGVWNFFGVLYNIIIGLFFTVYILANKEAFSCQAKKILFATFKRSKANNILRVAKQCHFKFIGSITGKVIDSAIIGILCFVGMVILDIDNKLLISIIIGVTNIIPFFGPFIGGIPCTILILCDDPWKALYFIIFIVVLQQLDGNLIGPKILGDSVGISAVWVLFACVFFGSLWGLVGMLIGVPLMASIYLIIKEIVEYRLRKKCLHTETDAYIGVDHVNEQEVILVERNDAPETMTVEEYYKKMREERENPIEYTEEYSVFRDRSRERKEKRKERKTQKQAEKEARKKYDRED